MGDKDKNNSGPIGGVIKDIFNIGKKKIEDAEKIYRYLNKGKDALEDLFKDEKWLKETIKDIEDNVLNNPDTDDTVLKDLAEDCKDYLEKRLKKVNKK